MKTRLPLILSIAIVGLLLAFASVAKAADGDPTYTGELKAFTTTSWTLTDGTLDKVFQIDPNTTIVPKFFALKDTVVTTYTEVTPGVFLSKEFKVLNSGVGTTYTYSDTLTAVVTGTTSVQWTVGPYTFSVPVNLLPPYYKVNDKVAVTFHIVNGEFVVNEVKVTETVVGTKVESSRCQNRTKDQPAIYKLAKEVNDDPQKLTGYFCSGFGVGEIRLAYKLADKDKGYTAAMLLAMRAEGKSWGEIKQMVAKAQVTTTNPTTGSTITNTSPGNSGNAVNHGKGNNGNGSDKNKPNKGKKP